LFIRKNGTIVLLERKKDDQSMKGRVLVRKYEFRYDERLEIEIPYMYADWEQFTQEEQYQIIYRWEKIRSQIPDRIKYLEKMIQERELKLQIEDDFQSFCQLSSEISDLASRIIDLNLWFRTQEEVTVGKVHS
jgi:hypothetical protein